MSSTPELKIDWATAEAARFACTHWHYSKCLPAFKAVRVGVWEDGRFIGVVMFGSGANNNIGSPYGLSQQEVCELTRVALTKHRSTVSRVVAISIRFLRKQSPGLKLIVSYADPEQGHTGTIYQAGGWIYAGRSKAQQAVIVDGKLMHKRSAASLFGGSIKGLQRSAPMWKHTYLMPLDAGMKARIEPLRKPYPKRAKEQDSEHPSELGGATPTRTLQISGSKNDAPQASA